MREGHINAEILTASTCLVTSLPGTIILPATKTGTGVTETEIFLLINQLPSPHHPSPQMSQLELIFSLPP